MNTKISRLSIESFRGIPQEVKLNFTPENTNKSVSLILSGDNGTGKSSIADALEFALQGKIRRSSTSAYSMSVNKPPEVTVFFSDNTTITRKMVFDGKHWELSDVEPHPNFAISPFLLKRSDILRFSETPDISRQRIFLEYFKGSISHTTKLYEAQELRGQQIQDDMDKKLIQKRKAITRFGEILKINPDEIPTDIKLFNLFVAEKLYKGLPSYARYKKIQQGEQLLPPIIYSQIKQMRNISAKISALKKELKQTVKESQKKDTTVLQSILSHAGERLTDAFKKISPRNFVEKISIEFGNISDMSLTVKIRLINGKQTSPQHIFSEANQDLLSLLLFTSVLQEAARHGQEKILILDDVFQSVDASIRVSVIDYLLQEFSDWQLIFILHDRLWKIQLKEILRKHNHLFIEKEIIRWSFENGPVIASGKETKQLLLDSIQRGEVVSICAHSGILLEFLCDRLSWVLPISVTRRKDDKYTLGDLWPGTAKLLKKTEIKEKRENIETWIHLRNLVGAHFNNWAQTVSLDEAISFAESTVNLYDTVYCIQCSSWIEPILEGKHGYMCRCGELRI